MKKDKHYVHYWDEKWDNPEIRSKWILPAVELLDYIHTHPYLPRKVLDISCGIGRHMLFYEKKGVLAIGLDNSPIAVKRCQSILKENNKDANVVLASMYRMPILSGSFDMIISLYSIYHGTIEEIQELINEIFRILQNGGRALINVAKYTHPINDELEIETRTYIRGSRKNGIHHYFLLEEILEMVSLFKLEKLIETDNYFVLHLKKCNMY